MLEAECLNQILRSILHPMILLEYALPPLEIRPPAAFKNKKSEHGKREEVDKAPIEQLKNSVLPCVC